MEFMDVLRSRRSVRSYTGEPVGEDELKILQEAVLRSPSSRSLNPWEFVFVREEKTLEALSQCKPHGAAFLRRAALGVVVCGDESRCDVWVEDCSIATLILHLTAHDLGLGSCWIQIRKRFHADGRPAEQVVREILGLPNRLQVLSMVAVGRPQEIPAGHEAHNLPSGRIHLEHFTHGR